MCVFCNLPKDRIISETDLFKLVYDNYPVNNGHILVISKNHKTDYFKLSYLEKQDLDQAISLAYYIINKKFNADGYNIGMNCGEMAGQTVMHFHCHVIPRYKGDIDNPKGGVRGVIPSKRIYNE